MTSKICPGCGQPFQPRPQVKKQIYCSTPACQQERRNTWQRKKLRNDPEYREHLRMAQQKWRDQHPNYSREYRKAQDQFAKKDKDQERSKPDALQKSDFAKVDAANWPGQLRAGVYRIRPIDAKGNAKKDAWIVEITPVCADCPCETDACKDGRYR